MTLRPSNSSVSVPDGHRELVGGRRVVALAARFLGQVELDVRVDALERDRAERLDACVAGGRQRSLADAAVGASDADDPAETAAVLEEAVHGVREVGALHERAVLGVLRVAEDRRELSPVRDPGRPVDRPARSQADERGDRRADPFDRLVRRWNLLDVHARGQITGRHLTPFCLCRSTGVELPKQIVGSRSWDGSGGGAAWVEHMHLRLVAGPEDELCPWCGKADAVAQIARCSS